MIQTALPQLTLRFAESDDVGLILEFIRGLAEYEKLTHEMVATEDGLRETLFGERPGAEVVLAFWDGEPAAFALFFPSYSTFLGRPGIYQYRLILHRRDGERLLSNTQEVRVLHNR